MASFVTSIKSSLGSSKSAFLQHGFSSQSPNLPGFVSKARSFGVSARAATERSIHDFTVKDIDGKDVALSKFKGKVLLIVNVASQCGLTSSNYSELTHVYEKYKTQGFEILAFPLQPYKAEFPILDKVDVNGPILGGQEWQGCGEISTNNITFPTRERHSEAPRCMSECWLQ
ncbi:hypothetical protein OIU76_008677 [Salix suchowensis]|nr:hypothetical protein OIU76_008677 [Salix suchowensis]